MHQSAFRPLRRLVRLQAFGFQKGAVSALQIHQIALTFHILPDCAAATPCDAMSEVYPHNRN